MANRTAQPARAALSIVLDAEPDMRKVYDLALIVDASLADEAPMTLDMQRALSWLTAELVSLGERLKEHHDAIYAAVKTEAAR